MALGYTQPPTEMNTRNLPGLKRRPTPKVDNFAAICELTLTIVASYRDSWSNCPPLFSMTFFKASEEEEAGLQEDWKLLNS
jgi:hypothetical protein